MANHGTTIQTVAKRELAILLSLLVFGLVILPIGVFFVGTQVFGEYGDAGFSGFFNTLGGKLRSGDLVAWFLVLSPYLAWQTIRLAVRAWKYIGSS